MIYFFKKLLALYKIVNIIYYIIHNVPYKNYIFIPSGYSLFYAYQLFICEKQTENNGYSDVQRKLF